MADMWFLQTRAIFPYSEVDLRMLRKLNILGCLQRKRKDNCRQEYHRPDLLLEYQHQGQQADRDNQMD
jgi:hypothetical protein